MSPMSPTSLSGVTTPQGDRRTILGVNLTTGIDQVERNITSFDLRTALSSPVDLLIGSSLAVLGFLGVAKYGADVLQFPGVLLATAPQAMRRTQPWLTITLTFIGAVLIVMFPLR